MTLHIELSPTLIVACDFFTVEEIELDVSPNDLQSAGAVSMLVDFMKWLACVVDRSVFLTHENMPENVILRIDSTTLPVQSTRDPEGRG